VTLIIGVRAADCFVVAADSLTTGGGGGIKCDTVKVHQVTDSLIAAGAGNARVLGRYWHEILPDFLEASFLAPVSTAVPGLRAFLDSEISQVPRNNIGACSGGNNFLVGGASSVVGPDVWLIERIADRRAFEQERAEPPAAPATPIWWLGDLQGLEPHMSTTTAAYAANMTESRAVAFAAKAIADGIKAARSIGLRTIGGSYVFVAVAAAAGVTFRWLPSGVPCP
jgi:hypothetical protein